MPVSFIMMSTCQYVLNKVYPILIQAWFYNLFAPDSQMGRVETSSDTVSPQLVFISLITVAWMGIPFIEYLTLISIDFQILPTWRPLTPTRNSMLFLMIIARHWLALALKQSMKKKVYDFLYIRIFLFARSYSFIYVVHRHVRWFCILLNIQSNVCQRIPVLYERNILHTFLISPKNSIAINP